MVNDRRQRCISNPETIFEKFREKAAAAKADRDPNQRHNPKLMPSVPKIDDEDIAELIEKYRQRAAEEGNNDMPNDDDNDQKTEHPRMQKLRMDAKRKQMMLVNNIEKELKKHQRDKKQFNIQQLIMTLKYNEFQRNQRLVDEVNFADKESLKQLFLYVLNSELSWDLEADAAAAEHHNGKFDPAMLKWADPKNLK